MYQVVKKATFPNQVLNRETKSTTWWLQVRTALQITDTMYLRNNPNKPFSFPITASWSPGQATWHGPCRTRCATPWHLYTLRMWKHNERRCWGWQTCILSLKCFLTPESERCKVTKSKMVQAMLPAHRSWPNSVAFMIFSCSKITRPVVSNALKKNPNQKWHTSKNPNKPPKSWGGCRFCICPFLLYFLKMEEFLHYWYNSSTGARKAQNPGSWGRNPTPCFAGSLHCYTA